jgi:hypothetical protein
LNFSFRYNENPTIVPHAGELTLDNIRIYAANVREKQKDGHFNATMNDIAL